MKGGRRSYFEQWEEEEGEDLYENSWSVNTVESEGSTGNYDPGLDEDTKNKQPDEEARYAFNIHVDQIYTETEFLKKALGEIFNLTPDDAALFVQNGWKFTDPFKEITQKDIGGSRKISVSKKEYVKIVGNISESNPGSNLGKRVQELTAELEKLKNKYDEAYTKYSEISRKFLIERNGIDNVYPVIYADNTRVVTPSPAGAIVTENTSEPYDQKLIREEMEKEDGIFGELKKEYPDINWASYDQRMDLDDMAWIVINNYRKTNTINDYLADALETAIVGRYRLSKRKALQQVLSDKLSDNTIKPVDELIYYETIRNDVRQIAVNQKLISKELMMAWASAQIEILKAQTAYRVSGETISANIVAIQEFYDLLIPFINQKTTSTTINERGMEYELESNPIIEPYKLSVFSSRAKELPATRDGWAPLFNDFREASFAMDKLITDKLKEKGMTDEADKLAFTAEATKELDQLIERHGKVYKVNAFFYPEGFTDYMNLYSKEEIVETGIPLQLYLWKQGNEWGLTDITRAGSGSIPENTNSNLTDLFAELDSNLRFPSGEGTLFWNIPMLGEGGFTTITGDMSLSEWFTYIGLAIGAVLLAAATFGASIPATAVIITSALLVTGSVLSMVEKSEQGMLTAKDVVIELANIVSSASMGISAGLGKIILRGVGATGTAARLAVMADRFYFPIIVAGLTADAVSFATITVDALARYEELNKLPEGSAKTDAMKRLFATLILQGTLTILTVKSDLKQIQAKKDLVIEMDLNTNQISASLFKPKTVLPRKNGRWEGEPGNSNWYSDLPEVIAITKGKPVPYKDGYPDFSEWSKANIKFDNLDGTSKDFDKVYERVAQLKNLPNKTAAKRYLKEQGLTPHHHQDGQTIQLVPTVINKIPHSGGASILRNK